MSSPSDKAIEATVKFEPRDLWLGVYWTWEHQLDRAMSRHLLVYVCLLPCLPIVLRFTRFGGGS